MPQVIEIVKFRVHPAKEQLFLATREEVVNAIAEEFPGLIRVQLGRIAGDLWVDVALWESRAEAERAAAACSLVPAFKEWSTCISEEVSMEYATVAEGSGA